MPENRADVVTVRPGGTLTIRYDGPLTTEQAQGIREKLARALPGVEVITVIVGQPASVAVTQAVRMLAAAGVTADLAAEMAAGTEQAGLDPVAFARYFTRVKESRLEA
jgi:hypothetical protein